MLTDDNKALVQRFYEEVINQKNLAALDQFVSPNAVNHTVPSGFPQGPSQFLSMHLNAFPDVKVTVQDLHGDGDQHFPYREWQDGGALGSRRPAQCAPATGRCSSTRAGELMLSASGFS